MHILAGRVRTFINQNSGKEFDPNTDINQYRSGIDSYIATANTEKESPFYRTDSDDEELHLFHIDSSTKHNKPEMVATTFGPYPNNIKIIIQEKLINTGIFKTKVRIYTPITQNDQDLKGVIIYFTGSGFVHNSFEWQKRNCKTLAKETGCIVINPQERVAPEHKFPQGLNECLDLTKWVIQNGETLGGNSRAVSLCGFSSGGNFVAVITRKLIQAGFKIEKQCLISPWLDLTCSSDSYTRFGHGYLLDREVCTWLKEKYLSKTDDALNPDASPLLYEGDFSCFPPTIIVVGENDPFVDECQAYSIKLQKAGVSVSHKVISNQIHEFAGCNRFKITERKKDDPIDITVAFLKN